MQALLGPVHPVPGYEGACLGATSLERLRGNLQSRLAARGYFTESEPLVAFHLRATASRRLTAELFGSPQRMDHHNPKIKLLQEAALQFEQALAAQEAADPEAAAVLRALRPLFGEIAQGSVVPPADGRFQRQFHSEHPRHGAGTPVFAAQAEFLGAIEDWRSKPWFPK